MDDLPRKRGYHHGWSSTKERVIIMNDLFSKERLSSWMILFFKGADIIMDDLYPKEKLSSWMIFILKRSYHHGISSLMVFSKDSLSSWMVSAKERLSSWMIFSQREGYHHGWSSPKERVIIMADLLLP